MRNNMKIKTFVPIILLIGGVFAFSAHAQTADQEWRRVEALKNRTSLIVETKTGKTIKGKFAALTPTDLNLTKGKRGVTIAKTDIDRVYLTRKRSVLTRVLIGAAAGAGIGFGIGGIVAVATKTSGLAAAAGFIYGIPIGAVIGGVTGGKNRKGEMLYLSR
jgi:hypothetical protein